MISIILPVYNEEKGIAEVLAGLLEVAGKLKEKHEVIVVDDGSIDTSAAIIQTFPVKLISNRRNRGYGRSLKTGIKAAAGDKIVIIDGDGTYPCEMIPQLIKQLKNVDMTVGSRTGESVAIPLVRRPAKFVLAKLANYLTEENIPDLNSGLRAFKKDACEEYFHILPDGFSFTTTITLAFLCDGLTVEYLPINYHARKGISKIRPIKDTFNFLLLILRVVIYFEPLKVLLPVCLGLFSLGAIVLILSYLAGKVMDITVIVLISSALQVGVIGLLADLVVKRAHLPKKD